MEEVFGMKRILIFICTVLGLALFSINAQVLADMYIENGEKTGNPRMYTYDNFQFIQTIDAKTNRIYDYPQAYAMDYPANFEVDTTLAEVKTILKNTSTQIEIYHDDLSGSGYDAGAYQKLSNYFLNFTVQHQLQEERYININGYRAHLLKWTRPLLKAVANDKNNYLSLEIVKSSAEVYTIMVKSSASVDYLLPYLNTFHIIEQRGAARNNVVFKASEKERNDETDAFFNEYFRPESGLAWGIYEHTAPAKMSFLQLLDKKLGYRFKILAHYHTFHTPFPMKEMKNAYEDGRVVELTMQTMWFERDNNSTSYQLLNGEYDVYLKNYALQAKAFGHPILFRFNNEMNTDWCSYSSYFTAKDTELFKETWRHVYNIFKECGADNVLWIWNPNDISFPSFKWNDSVNYFPGSEYVDIIGMTGYNTGTYYSNERWRTFNQIYEPLYLKNSLLYNYPYMITEFASSSVGGNKEEWIADMFKQIKKYTRIKAAVWFNGVDFDANMQQARKYRLDDTQPVVDAFNAGFAEYNTENKKGKK
jgi:hypothetical protein